MKRKRIFPLTHNELESLPTRRLLARLKRLHQCEESLALSDREAHDETDPNAIEFKESPEWVAEYHRLKEILAHREHVPKGDALAQRRQERVRRGKNVERKQGRHKRG